MIAPSSMTALPSQPRDPHCRPLPETNPTAPRSEDLVVGWLDGQHAQAPRPPEGAPAGAPPAHASAAALATPLRPPVAHVLGPRPRPVALTLARQQRQAHPPSGGCDRAARDDGPREASDTHHGATTTRASKVVVRAHVRRFTDRSTGISSYREYPEHFRALRGTACRSASMPADAPSRRDSSLTSNGQRGEQDPRRAGSSSRSSTVDSMSGARS